MAVKKTCLYGCTDPTTCPWPHKACSHCKVTRKASGWGFDEKAFDNRQPYNKLHPVTVVVK